MPLRNVATNYTFEQQRQEINLLAADVDTLDTNKTTTARSAISVTDAGGEGSLAYNDGTGVITYTGPAALPQSLGTGDSPTFTNLTLSGYLAGPATLTIDPAAVGDNTGTVVIAGNLQVDGTTTTINSTTMTVDDLNITLASGAANAAAANGAGLTVDGAGATLLYNGTTDEWAFNKSLTSLSVSGTSTFNASPLGAANVGVLIDGASGAVVTAATGTNSLFKGFTQGTNTATVNIKANGSAEFSGQLNLGANMQFTAADPELEFNNGGPRFKVPAANTLSIHTGGGLGTTTAERLRINPDGDVLPGADATQDLGSASARWANIYSADLQLSNEGGANDVDGTWGQYTIQEGEEDLYLLNRRNGKTYKFVLQEVQ
jgi:hypothetical protein